MDLNRCRRVEKLEIEGRAYSLHIHYEQRDSARASIGKQSINIRIPVGLSREGQFKQLLEMKNWIRKKLKGNTELLRPRPQKQYSNGDILKVGGEEYVLDIKFKDEKGSSAHLVGNTIKLRISSNCSQMRQNKHISTLLSRVAAGKRLPKLKHSIEQLNRKHFNQKINSIYFKHNKSCWGSCSTKGNINISTRLLFAPDDVLEYVVIHELAHLIEHNHSKRFWNLVQNAMPDYKEKERWLKENRDKCQF